MPGYSHTYIDAVIGGEDQTFDLTDTPSLSIGRHPQCTVVLTDDPMVSRKHALVQRESSGDFYLSDLGSRNGTTRNGMPVTSPVLLQDGDAFTIGSHRFVFHHTAQSTAEVEALQEPTDVLVVERMMTILVLDIRNYTVMARELGEARVSEVMNRFFHEAGNLLKQRGSWAQKYIGDAVMALWVHAHDEGRAHELASIFESMTGLAEIIGRINEEIELPRPLAWGAGVNSGVAVTGNMGSAGLSDHTALGDAVNKAFRLETATKDVGRDVLVGSSTFELMSTPEGVVDAFTEHLVELKGYDRPERAWGLSTGDVRRVAEALRAQAGGS
jgi:adenylate cyclase